MNLNQQKAAQKSMEEWLSDSHELGKKPCKIECMEEFELHEMHYYIFRFKTGIFGQWLVGVCGGFEDDDLESCGHTFSNMQKYDSTTAQNDCIEMVEMIRTYWMEQAKKFSQSE